MDLTLKVNENGTEILNIRVAIILETEKGFVFSKNKHKDYYFPIGGRAKFGESAVESAVREFEEEIGIRLSSEKFKLLGIIENFWSGKENPDKNLFQPFRVHEINFVFKVPKQEKLLTPINDENIELHEFTMEQIQNEKINILPDIYKKIILDDSSDSFFHYIIR